MVIYLRLIKALYGCMKSVLLRYDQYSKTLNSHGFKVNPYGRFIANSTINGKQFIIAQYVEYNKVSHIYEEFNTKIGETIPEHFGELTVSRGNNRVTGNGHIVLSWWKSITVYEVLHQVNNCFVW